MSNIVFTGGGTAGHYMPNLAIIPLVKDNFDKVYYIGSENGPERQAATSAGVSYYAVTSAKLKRSLDLKNLAIPFKLYKGVKQAEAVLREIEPKVIFSKGGYVALPVAIASKKLNIPLVIHESDLSMGLANKIASRFSTKVLTSFEKTAESIKNAEYVGAPLRRELFIKRDRAAILKKIGISSNGKKTILVTGGSQGSANINENLEKCLDKLIIDYNVIHLCGKGKATGTRRKGYVQFEFYADMGELFAVSDLAVSRGGANTLFELIALCVPTLAIPLSKGSRGDQIANCEYFKGKGYLHVLPDDELTPEKLHREIKLLDKSADILKKNCAKSGIKDGTKRIAEYLVNV